MVNSIILKTDLNIIYLKSIQLKNESVEIILGFQPSLELLLYCGFTITCFEKPKQQNSKCSRGIVWPTQVLTCEI